MGRWELGTKGRLRRRGQHEQTYRGMRPAGYVEVGRGTLLPGQYKLEHKQGGGEDPEKSLTTWLVQIMRTLE